MFMLLIQGPHMRNKVLGLQKIGLYKRSKSLGKGLSKSLLKVGVLREAVIGERAYPYKCHMTSSIQDVDTENQHCAMGSEFKMALIAQGHGEKPTIVRFRRDKGPCACRGKKQCFKSMMSNNRVAACRTEKSTNHVDPMLIMNQQKSALVFKPSKKVDHTIRNHKAIPLY